MNSKNDRKQFKLLLKGIYLKSQNIQNLTSFRFYIYIPGKNILFKIRSFIKQENTINDLIFYLKALLGLNNYFIRVYDNVHEILTYNDLVKNLIGDSDKNIFFPPIFILTYNEEEDKFQEFQRIRSQSYNLKNAIVFGDLNERTRQIKEKSKYRNTKDYTKLKF